MVAGSSKILILPLFSPARSNGYNAQANITCIWLSTSIWELLLLRILRRQVYCWSQCGELHGVGQLKLWGPVRERVTPSHVRTRYKPHYRTVLLKYASLWINLVVKILSETGSKVIRVRFTVAVSINTTPDPCLLLPCFPEYNSTLPYEGEQHCPDPFHLTSLKSRTCSQ